jgi:glycerol-3-phosphate dehydrogenase
MPVAGTQTSESEKPSVADRIVDAVQHAAHVSHEARLVKSLAYDAIEDGAHQAKRAVKNRCDAVSRGWKTSKTRVSIT